MPLPKWGRGVDNWLPALKKIRMKKVCRNGPGSYKVNINPNKPTEMFNFNTGN